MNKKAKEKINEEKENTAGSSGVVEYNTEGRRTRGERDR